MIEVEPFDIRLKRTRWPVVAVTWICRDSNSMAGFTREEVSEPRGHI